MKTLTPEKIKEVKEYFKMEENEPISFQNWPDGLELKDKEALVELYNWMIKFKKNNNEKHYV